MGKGFGKLDEDSESSVELKSHGGNGEITSAGDHHTQNGGAGGGWPFDNSNLVSYSCAAAKTPAKARDIVDEERDIMVKREVHVTAVGGGGEGAYAGDQYHQPGAAV